MLQLGVLASGSGSTLERLARACAEWVLLLGYLRLIGPATPTAYGGRMRNTHPALLPRYGGAGMYGAHAHRAVLAP